MPRKTPSPKTAAKQTPARKLLRALSRVVEITRDDNTTTVAEFRVLLRLQDRALQQVLAELEAK